MAYHDELLELASELVKKKPVTRANLRRAVSTAYYALFHLLVSETTLNWNRESSRNALGRMFDHGLMKRVSDRAAKKGQRAGQDVGVDSGLRLVAKAFVDLRDLRHIADYDNGASWTVWQGINAVARASSAFQVWGEIKHADIAQEYLVALLIRPRD